MRNFVFVAIAFLIPWASYAKDTDSIRAERNSFPIAAMKSEPANVVVPQEPKAKTIKINQIDRANFPIHDLEPSVIDLRPSSSDTAVKKSLPPSHGS